MKTHCPYHNYYVSQAGSGSSVIYRGSVYQRGHGIGSFLGGIFRSIMPFLKTGAKTVGKVLLRSGAGFLGDLAEERPAKEAFNRRMKEAGGNLKRKAAGALNGMMSGSGSIKRRRTLKQKQTVAKRRTQTLSRVKKQRQSDIFD